MIVFIVMVSRIFWSDFSNFYFWICLKKDCLNSSFPIYNGGVENIEVLKDNLSNAT